MQMTRWIAGVIIGLGAIGASCTVEPAPSGTSVGEPQTSTPESTSDFICQCPNEPIIAGPEAFAELQAQVLGPCQNICGVCGDGTCNANESPFNCPVDCPASACGNGVCESGESPSSCPSDCGPPPPVCGNGQCESGESSASCPSDCGSPHQCGNHVCDPGERISCPSDCGVCIVQPCPNEPIAAPATE